MKKMFKLIFVILLFSLVIPIQVSGTRPIHRIIVGCLVDGMLFSLKEGYGPLPDKKAYLITVPPSVDLAPYEGKKIRLQGFLSPGDRFKPDLEKGIEVLGACDEEDRVAIHKELPWVYRNKAKGKASQNDWNTAWKYLNKAIEIDSSNCSLYATKADFYTKQGKFEEAVKEAQRAVDYGCKDYNNWAFLGELLEKVGKISAAIDAYEQAVQVCEYKPDRERFQQIIDQLKSGARKPPQKEGAFQFK